MTVFLLQLAAGDDRHERENCNKTTVQAQQEPIESDEQKNEEAPLEKARTPLLQLAPELKRKLATPHGEHQVGVIQKRFAFAGRGGGNVVPTHNTNNRNFGSESELVLSNNRGGNYGFGIYQVRNMYLGSLHCHWAIN